MVKVKYLRLQFVVILPGEFYTDKNLKKPIKSCHRANIMEEKGLK